VRGGGSRFALLRAASFLLAPRLPGNPSQSERCSMHAGYAGGLEPVRLPSKDQGVTGKWDGKTFHSAISLFWHECPTWRVRISRPPSLWLFGASGVKIRVDATPHDSAEDPTLARGQGRARPCSTFSAGIPPRHRRSMSLYRMRQSELAGSHLGIEYNPKPKKARRVKEVFWCVVLLPKSAGNLLKKLSAGADAHGATPYPFMPSRRWRRPCPQDQVRVGGPPLLDAGGD
jgi:hypothetical protein